MDRPALLLLVRHAESERNRVKRGAVYFADEEMRRTVKGVPDHKIPITPEGVKQARETGWAIRERFGVFDYVYHSGYERTQQTTNLILDAYKPEDQALMRVRANHFLRERDPGHTYDMTEAEADLAFPWLREYWKTMGGFFAVPPGGESLAQMVERVYSFVNMLFRDRQGERVMVVAHGGTIRCLRFLLERWDYDRALKWPPGESPKNCGLTLYEFDRILSRLTLREYNTVCYQLKEERRP